MNRIDEMITQLCPAGVPFKPLGEVSTFNRGTAITASQATPGDIPVVANGPVPTYTHSVANRQGETIVVARSGAYAGLSSYWNQPIFLTDAFSVHPDISILMPKFVYHLLRNRQDTMHSMKKGAGVPHVRVKEIEAYSIPVPPIQIQQEIVKVLDTFSELETELEGQLEAELKARLSQYKFYRDRLFASVDGAKVLMADIGVFHRGRRFTKQDVVEVGIPAIHYGEIYTHYGTSTDVTLTHVRTELANQLRFAEPADVVIATVGETVEDVAKAVAWLGDVRVAIHDDTALFRSDLNPKYVAYAMQTADFHAQKNKYVARGKVKRVSADGLSRIAIPVPPREEQDRIVAILDKFDALVNDLSIDLPAELNARRQQYEHYRDRLLTFQEAA